MFTNVSIGKRLGVGFTLILLMTVAIAAVGVWRLDATAKATETMMAKPLAKERLVSDFHTLIFGSVRRTTAIVKSSDPAVAAVFKDDAAWAMKEGDVLLGKLVPLLTEPEEKAQYSLVMERRLAYNSAHDRAIKARAEGRVDESETIFQNEFVPAARGFQGALQDLVTLQRKQIDSISQAIGKTGEASALAIQVFALVAVLSFVPWGSSGLSLDVNGNLVINAQGESPFTSRGLSSPWCCFQRPRMVSMLRLSRCAESGLPRRASAACEYSGSPVPRS